jgi:nitrogen regulatory protein P-II 1
MKLLFVVLNTPDKLEEVLEGLVEAGVTGATVVESVGMGHLLENVPLFASMRSMFRSAHAHNHVIFSVVDDGLAAEVLSVAERILDCSHGKGSGIAFTVPVDAAIGVHKAP